MRLHAQGRVCTGCFPNPTRAHSPTPGSHRSGHVNAARGGVGWGCREPPVHRAGPSPALTKAPAQPESCAWGRLPCSRGSWLGVAGYGPKAVTHSGRPLPLCPFSQLPAIPGASSAQKEPQEKKGEASELAPAQAARPPSGEEEQQGALKAPSSSETSLPQERTSAAVPLVHRRTRSLQSLPPKIKAGLPQRRGMSCPVLPTLTRAWGAQEKQSPT